MNHASPCLWFESHLGRSVHKEVCQFLCKSSVVFLLSRNSGNLHNTRNDTFIKLKNLGNIIIFNNKLVKQIFYARLQERVQFWYSRCLGNIWATVIVLIDSMKSKWHTLQSGARGSESTHGHHGCPFVVSWLRVHPQTEAMCVTLYLTVDSVFWQRRKTKTVNFLFTWFY